MSDITDAHDAAIEDICREILRVVLRIESGGYRRRGVHVSNLTRKLDASIANGAATTPPRLHGCAPRRRPAVKTEELRELLENPPPSADLIVALRAAVPALIAIAEAAQRHQANMNYTLDGEGTGNALARTLATLEGGDMNNEVRVSDAAAASALALAFEPNAELHIVFDGPPGNQSGRFVECEDSSGRSVRVGEWRERPDRLWELVIPGRNRDA